MIQQRYEKEFYSEAEAARALEITLDRLHMLLDQHVFNDGSRRPSEITLRSAELVLLAFWNRTMANPKVIRMPRRN
jgi:hypothetical protein